MLRSLALVVGVAVALGMAACGGGAARPVDGGGGGDGGGVDAPAGDGPPSGLPPDPSTVAPSIGGGQPTDFGAATAFLYSGDDPIQTGVAPGTIEPRRAAVLRGLVAAVGGAPLPGVAVTVLGHPELGATRSRADGRFDLAVNGGGQLVVEYALPGYLPAQRPVRAPWVDFAFVPTVTLRPLDGQATAVALGGAALQAVRSSVAADGDGARQATLLVPAGTTAALELPDGSSQEITTLTLRATEHTVGDDGPQAMPGALPPASGYTYAVAWTVDEALAAGATTVRFDRPVLHYVENFLGFPVGGDVPVGGYDPSAAAWVPAPNGRVVAVVSVTDGVADLDTDGDGAPDSGAAIGVTDAERAALGGLYAPGTSLWRVPVAHLSSWDCNWPYGPPSDATPPQQPPPIPDVPPDLPTCTAGSIIECQSQTLGERVPVAGTPFALRYASDRAPGRTAAYTLDLPLSGAAPPASLAHIDLEISVAGQQHAQRLGADPGQLATFTWDGTDAYGRTLYGKQRVTTRVGYVYTGVYQQPAQLAASFAALSGVPLSNNPARGEVTLWQEWHGLVGTLDARLVGLGGWSLDVHHVYDPVGRVLYQGDGGRRSLDSLGTAAIATVAGGAATSALGDGGPATAASLFHPDNLAAAPDGGYLIVDGVHQRIRAVSAAGIITTVAGTGTSGFSGDGGPATAAALADPAAIALGPDGSFYIADRSNHRVRRVGTDGVITTVAGGAQTGFAGDGGPATAAQLGEVYGVAAAPDGTLYIADLFNRRIRRVGLDGTITTVAGTGDIGASGDGGPATAARLRTPYRVAVAPDGALLIADPDNANVRRVGPDGIMSTIAGNGTSGFSGDGGPATAAQLQAPGDVAAGPDGSIYVADSANNRVRLIGADGIITTLAGSAGHGFVGDGDRAVNAQLNGPNGVAVAPDGSVLVADTYNHVVRRVAPALPGAGSGEILIASADGREVYRMTGSGRHLATIDALTGATRLDFFYDKAFRLTAVRDGDGNVTSVARDAAGQPTALVAPFGQTTALTTTADGWLASVADPVGGTTTLEYAPGGLLTALTRPAGGRASFTYDALGRLARDADAAGGWKTLARTDAAQGYAVALATAAGRAGGYSIMTDAVGVETRVDTLFSGLVETRVRAPDGTLATTLASGQTVVAAAAPDPRFGVQAPLAGSVVLTTPRGLSATVTTTRTVSLAQPLDPLSLQSLQTTVTVDGRATVERFDAATRTVTVTSPEGRQLRVVLDGQGRIVEEQVGDLFPVDLTYDGAGRLIVVAQGTGAAARTASLGYDERGFLASVTDPLGGVTRLGRDATGRLTSETRPDGRTTTLAWDADGNLAGLTPPGRPPHTFGYTPVDLVAAYAPPEVIPGAVATAFTYDADRQPLGLALPGGASVTAAYDPAGRLGALTTPAGTATWSYDAATGLPASASAAGGITLGFTFDGELPTAEEWSGPVPGRVTTAYGAAFAVSGRGVNGVAVALGRDRDDLVVAAGDLTITRDPTGRVTGTALGGVTDASEYNGFGELVAYTATYAGAPIYALALVRDALGRVAQRTETLAGATHTADYAYDAAGRLTQVTRDGAPAASYAYDANDNRVDAGATVDDQDRLLRFGAATYAYTADGRLASRADGAGTTSYSVDPLGVLRAVTLPDGRAITYLVDARGRRVGKAVAGVLATGWLYQDARRPIAEVDDHGAVVSRFVWGARDDAPDYLVRGGATYRIVSDERGSPRLVVDVATGTVAQRLDYDAFGAVILDSSPGWQPFGFAGGLYDPDTGLVRFGARDYDPATGRFIVKDPISFAGRLTNLYAYAGGDPVNRADPDGLQPQLNNFDEQQFQKKQQQQQTPPQEPSCTPKLKRLQEYQTVRKEVAGEKSAQSAADQKNALQRNADGINAGYSGY